MWARLPGANGGRRSPLPAPFVVQSAVFREDAVPALRDEADERDDPEADDAEPLGEAGGVLFLGEPGPSVPVPRPSPPACTKGQ